MCVGHVFDNMAVGTGGRGGGAIAIFCQPKKVKFKKITPPPIQKSFLRPWIKCYHSLCSTNETVGAIAEAYPPNPQEPAKLVVDFGTGRPI